MNTLMEVVGRDGQVSLLPDRIIITRKGFFNFFKYGLNARQEIPVSAISTIHFKNANALRFGHIDFVYPGRGDVDPKKNPYAVTFGRKLDPSFVALKEKIFELMRQQQTAAR